MNFGSAGQFGDLVTVTIHHRVLQFVILHVMAAFVHLLLSLLLLQLGHLLCLLVRLLSMLQLVLLVSELLILKKINQCNHTCKQGASQARLKGMGGTLHTAGSENFCCFAQNFAYITVPCRLGPLLDDQGAPLHTDGRGTLDQMVQMVHL